MAHFKVSYKARFPSGPVESFEEVDAKDEFEAADKVKEMVIRKRSGVIKVEILKCERRG